MCKLGNYDVISQLANMDFWFQHTKLPRIKVSNPFLHKMPVHVNFSDFFLTNMASMPINDRRLIKPVMLICFAMLSSCFKAAYSVTINIFRKKYFLFKSFVKVE